ncbi:hypothetical protein [Pseudomonas fluorescens group sp. PF-69]
MTRPTRSTLRQGQTLYVLVHPLLSNSGRHEALAVPIDSNAARDRVSRLMGPAGVYSYSRKHIESLAAGLNARLIADQARALGSPFPRSTSQRQRPFRSLVHVA